MKFAQIALMEAYHRLRNAIPDPYDLGQQYKPNRREFTDAELTRFNEAYTKELRRLERRLENARIDFTPVGD